MARRIVFWLCVLGFVGYFSKAEVYEDDGDNGPLSNNCIRCICEVFGCPQEKTCTDTCGPFRITQVYWSAAHKNKNGNPEEFRKCTLDAWCATRTVQAYMKQFLPKCVADSGARSVCETAMALHHFGSWSCVKPVSQRQSEVLAGCMSRRAWAWLYNGTEIRLPTE